MQPGGQVAVDRVLECLDVGAECSDDPFAELGLQARTGLVSLGREGVTAAGINGVLAIVLLALAAVFVVDAIRAARRPAEPEADAAPAA